MQKPTAKPFDIPKTLIYEAYKKVKANNGAGGVDEQSIEAFEVNRKDNLYKLWNRMSSGTYFPPPVKAVEIPKKTDGTRTLGIPTVADRIAQTAAKMVLEPEVEPMFHPDSYAYRPCKSALDAVATCRKRCWRLDWVVDIDIASFFDTVPHDHVLELVSRHTDLRWVLLYVERWLKAPLQLPDGTQQARDRGTPQGSAISPLLVNIFMHYVFDSWMDQEFSTAEFERYSDDVVVHAETKAQAEFLKAHIAERLAEFGLELHPDKTKIVYCKDDNRKCDHCHIRFDFCGFTFRPRAAQNPKTNKTFVGFVPAMGDESAKAKRAEMRAWRIGQRSGIDLRAMARRINPIVQGWINYYGKFYPSKLTQVLTHLNRLLVKWAMKKFKRLHRSRRRAHQWLFRIHQRSPSLFAHWRFGATPTG